MIHIKKRFRKVKKESITPAMSHHSFFSELLIKTLMMTLAEKALTHEVGRPGSSSQGGGAQTRPRGLCEKAVEPSDAEESGDLLKGQRTKGEEVQLTEGGGRV